MKNEVSVVFISILIFWLIFAPKSAIIPDTTTSGWITNSISFFLVLYVFRDLKYIFIGRNRTFNLLLLEYLAISVFSVYYNADTISKYELLPLPYDSEPLPQGITTVKYLLYYSIGLFASSLYIQRIADTIHIITLIKTFIILFIIVLIPSYIEVLNTPIEKGVLTEYSFGNKFTLGYLNLYLCTLYFFVYPRMDSKKHQLILSMLILLMIVGSVIADCSTMIMGALIFMYFSLFISDAMRNNLASAKTVLISLLVFDIGFFFLVSWLLQYDFIQYFIEDILREDLSLTGRVQIYKDIQDAFIESPWVGLGYGNSIVVAKYYTDAYDSQNGLIELFIQVGVVGVVSFLSLLYNASKKFKKNDIARYPFAAFMYAMIAIATIEIPFKFTFVFFLSFCFIQSKSYQRFLK